MNDICEFIVDCEHKTAPIDESGDYYSIRTPNIGRGFLKLENAYRVNQETYIKWTRRAIPQENDLIIAREAPVGNVAIIPKDVKACLGQRTVLVRPDKKSVYPKYLCYLLLSNAIQSVLLGQSTGSTVSHLNMRDIRGLELPALPPLPLQTRIADLLSAYDELIEVNNRRIALLEQTAEQLYKEWFVRLRFPGYARTKVRKGVPEGWRKVSFPEAVEINPRIKIDKHKEYTYVDMGSLNENSMITTSHSKRKPKGGAKFTNGDTLFSRITPCLQNGKIGLMQILRKGEVGFGSTEFIIFRSKTLTPEFVYFLSRNQSFRQNAINSMVGASGRQRVDNKCFDSFLFLHPPQSILEQFSDITSPMVRQIFKLNNHNQTLRRTRDLLLPRLISGQLSVAEAETALNA